MPGALSFFAQHVFEHVLARIKIWHAGEQGGELLRHLFDVVVMLGRPQPELDLADFTVLPGEAERMAAAVGIAARLYQSFEERLLWQHLAGHGPALLKQVP